MENWALTGVESAVCRSDQQLAALFGVFNRLYRDERMPAWEQVQTPQRRLLAALLLPLLVVVRQVAAAGKASRRAAGRAGRATRRRLRQLAPGAGEPGGGTACRRC